MSLDNEYQYGTHIRISTLISRLQQACRIFESEDSIQDHGRGAASIAVNAAIDFIDSLPEARASLLVQPLRALAFSLSDLEGGSQPPMLTATKTSHRPVATTTLQYIRGYLAFAMEVLMKAGIPRGEAAKLVARKANDVGISNAKLSGTQISGWRDAVTGRGDASEAKDRFTALLSYYEARGETEWSKKMADELIEFLPVAIPDLRFSRVD